MTTVSMKHAVDAIVAFMAREAQKVNPITDRFIAYAALGAAKANPDAVMARFKPVLEMAGVVDQEGNVCLEAVQGAMEMAFENVPSVRLAGFTFTREDADTLMRHLVK